MCYERFFSTFSGKETGAFQSTLELALMNSGLSIEPDKQKVDLMNSGLWGRGWSTLSLLSMCWNSVIEQSAYVRHYKAEIIPSFTDEETEAPRDYMFRATSHRWHLDSDLINFVPVSQSFPRLCCSLYLNWLAFIFLGPGCPSDKNLAFLSIKAYFTKVPLEDSFIEFYFPSWCGG